MASFLKPYIIEADPVSTYKLTDTNIAKAYKIFKSLYPAFPNNFTEEQLKKTRNALALMYSPDLPDAMSPDVERMQAINFAFTILSAVLEKKIKLSKTGAPEIPLPKEFSIADTPDWKLIHTFYADLPREFNKYELDKAFKIISRAYQPHADYADPHELDRWQQIAHAFTKLYQYISPGAQPPAEAPPAVPEPETPEETWFPTIESAFKFIRRFDHTFPKYYSLEKLNRLGINVIEKDIVPSIGLGKAKIDLYTKRKLKKALEILSYNIVHASYADAYKWGDKNYVVTDTADVNPYTGKRDFSIQDMWKWAGYREGMKEPPNDLRSATHRTFEQDFQYLAFSKSKFPVDKKAPLLQLFNAMLPYEVAFSFYDGKRVVKQIVVYANSTIGLLRMLALRVISQAHTLSGIKALIITTTIKSYPSGGIAWVLPIMNNQLAPTHFWFTTHHHHVNVLEVLHDPAVISEINQGLGI